MSDVDRGQLPVVSHDEVEEWPEYTHVSHGTVWLYRQTEFGPSWFNDGRQYE